MKEWPTLYKIDSNYNVITWDIYTEYDTYTVEYGVFSKQTTTTKVDGTNFGKTNERTPEEQAEFVANKLWNDQIEYKGYYKTIKEAKLANKAEIKRRGNGLGIQVNKAKTYTEALFNNNIGYPCIMQPKLDGVRCVATKTGNEVKLWSSGGKEYIGFGSIITRLNLLMQDGDIIDGELYKHGMPLKEIGGIAREQNSFRRKHLLDYIIFDFIKISNLGPNTIYDKRLHAFKAQYNNSIKSKNKLIPMFKINTKEQAEDLYNKFIQYKYEGAIYRNINMRYKFNRQSDMLKRKDFKEIDCLILDIAEEGKGNDEGTVGSFLVQTPKGKTFKVKPDGSRERRKYYFENQYKAIGKYITVRYLQEWDGIPQIPVGKGDLIIRNCKGID